MNDANRCCFCIITKDKLNVCLLCPFIKRSVIVLILQNIAIYCSQHRNEWAKRTIAERCGSSSWHCKLAGDCKSCRNKKGNILLDGESLRYKISPLFLLYNKLNKLEAFELNDMRNAAVHKTLLTVIIRSVSSLIENKSAKKANER